MPPGFAYWPYAYLEILGHKGPVACLLATCIVDGRLVCKYVSSRTGLTSANHCRRDVFLRLLSQRRALLRCQRGGCKRQAHSRPPHLHAVSYHGTPRSSAPAVWHMKIRLALWASQLQQLRNLGISYRDTDVSLGKWQEHMAATRSTVHAVVAADARLRPHTRLLCGGGAPPAL